ncbi:MAG: TatA/E family twin arginine-targeting protein translocase [Acidobacteria bacterium]|nr:TatA/E family twin arginine-targeting protein translocase [Acidobacteriota bacterium]
MGPLGVPEMIFIFVLALLIFGPKKLPELGSSLGKGISEFRRASNELKYTFEREMHNMERESESMKEATGTNSTYTPPPDEYPYSYESTSSASAPQAAESQPATPPEGSEVKHS